MLQFSKGDWVDWVELCVIGVWLVSDVVDEILYVCYGEGEIGRYRSYICYRIKLYILRMRENLDMFSGL